jgi:predicted nucleic acid-binding protein
LGEKDPEAAVSSPLIFDTDILISFTKKHAGAVKFLARVPLAERRISVISCLELMHGCRDAGELLGVNEFLTEAFVEVLPLTPQICDSARRLMKAYVVSRRPDLHDTLIASTALAAGEILATGNIKHFDFVPGLVLNAFRP